MKKDNDKSKSKNMKMIIMLGSLAIVGLSLFVFSLNGCITTNSNMNNHRVFSKYIGKEVVLLRNQNLWKMVKYQYTYHPYSMKEVGTEPSSRSGKFIMKVPRGTKIRINKVMKEQDSSGKMVYALCSMRTPDGKVIDFEYNWGGNRSFHRAPWEGKDVPPRREY